MARFLRPFDARTVKPRTEDAPEAIILKMYDEALVAVATAPKGNRNTPLNEQSYLIGRLVGAGLVGPGEAEAALLSAAKTSGHDSWAAKRTIRSGLTAGQARPWEVNGDVVTMAGRPVAPVPTPAADEHARQQAAKAEAARGLYLDAEPLAGGRGQAYLEKRGIMGFPEAVRYSRKFNGLVIPLTAPSGELAAVQKIPLNPDLTRGEKKTAGPMGNALFAVPGKPGAPAVVVDGPEDAMSVAHATGWRVFGSCSKQRFAYVAEHLPAGSRLVAVRDADGTDNSEYDKLVKACAERRIGLAFADPAGDAKDANDLLAAGGAEAVRSWLGGVAEAAWPTQAPVASPSVRTAPQALDLVPECFPRHLLHAPGAIGEIAAFITATARYPQPELALGTALTMLGALMGRRVKGPTGLRTNIMALGLADSGSGKGHGRDMAKRLLNEIGVPMLLGGDSIRSGAGLVSRMRDNPNTLYLLDEIGMFLSAAYDKGAGNHMREIVTLFTQFFSETSQTWMGSDYADRKLNAPAPIVQPHMSLFGITNPTSLWNAFGGGALKDGSVARYLVFHPNEMYPDRSRNLMDGETIPQGILDGLSAIVNDIPVPEGRGNMAGIVASADPCPYQVPVAPVARAALEDFEDANVRDRRKAAGTDRASIIARAVEHAWKIACIAAVADRPSAPLITLEHAQYGMSLAAWSTNWLDKQAASHVADSDFGRKLNKVLEIIRRAGADGLDKTELTRNTQRLLGGTRERDDILATLEESGLLHAAAIGGVKPRMHFWASEFAPKADNSFDGADMEEVS